MINLEPTVFVVDDDQAMRDSMGRLMESVGLAVQTYPNAEVFLEQFDSSRPGCLILDIRMPGMSGLDLQERLGACEDCIPIIIMSAHGDVEKAVRAMKSGAVDFIKKPYKGEVLLARIREALALDVEARRERARRVEREERLARLTPREQEVIELLVARQIGQAHRIRAGPKPQDG